MDTVCTPWQPSDRLLIIVCELGSQGGVLLMGYISKEALGPENTRGPPL